MIWNPYETTFLSVRVRVYIRRGLSLCVFYYLGIELRLSPVWNASELTALSQNSHGPWSPPISLLLFLWPPSLFSLCWFSVRISQCFDSGSCTSGFTGPDKFSVCICSSVKLRVRFISLGFSLSLSVCRRAHLRATRGKCVLLRCYCVCIGADELPVFPIKVSSPFHHLWASAGFCEPIWPLLYSKQTLFGNIWELLQGRCLTYLNISNYSHDLYTK